ncbi:uncharacterized protein LOC111878154 [Lactuca sativa]|uniref:uncharacterized protein LOC111878154 n=1 Tax=Lactuca sativa TaxID=4236 RepID=UPI000CD82B14|nr:uncharacterized protein LOC111878154 [Lactuca sativa]
MTGRREELREFWSLKGGRCVKYGNNSYDMIKGYGMITNGEFSIRKVDYMEGLQHNLISVSQLVVGIGLKVSFDDEGSEIIEKRTKKILLKSERKGEMYLLNLNPIKGKPTICLLSKKSEATPKLMVFIKQVELQLRKVVRNIRSDNGLEFKNKDFEEFLDEKGVTHNFSSPYTPPQNGIVERRNRSQCEAARTMLSFASLPLYFWADAIVAACYTQNRSFLNKRFSITPYTILNNCKPNVKFFHVFGLRCFIFNSKENRNKFDEYMLLFDEPERAIHSEAKATDNEIYSLKKIIDEAAKYMESEPQQPTKKKTQSEPTVASDQAAANDPPKESTTIQGEGSSTPKTTNIPF